MRKIKKIMAGALATVLCATSIFSKTPVTAEAAMSICKHSSSCYTSSVSYDIHPVSHWTNDLHVTYEGLEGVNFIESGYVQCTSHKTTYTYRCSKCGASYTQSTSKIIHFHNVHRDSLRY